MRSDFRRLICPGSLALVFYGARRRSTSNHFHIGAMTTPGFLRGQSNGVFLSVRLQPRASVNEIGQALGNELRIKVTAPPVDGAANEALVRLLAERLGCARNQVELARGHSSRHKVVRLSGIAAEVVAAKLAAP